MSNLKGVKVVMEKPQYNYVTDVNGAVPFAEIRAYFVGQRFNMGNDENENFVKCVDVIDLTGYKRYKVAFRGTTKGAAVAGNYPYSVTVWAQDEDGARLALYDKYEHISQFSAVELGE